MITRFVVVLAAVVLVAGAALYANYYLTQGESSCSPLGGARAITGQVTERSFGAITQYLIPGPNRWPNAIAVAPDGSVWFGEQAVPGVGHLLPDGNLTEYAWPGTQPQGKTCSLASIWGVTLWRGMVWATDGDGNRLVGLNPGNDTFRVVSLPNGSDFPYSLATGPDGSLWFTLLSSPASIGRLSADGQLSVYRIETNTRYIPTELYFLNSSYAYYVALDPTTGAGGLFAFNPSNVTLGINPAQVGPGYRLFSPNSVSFGGNLVWVTQHGASSVAAYDLSTSFWTVYPTSTVNYTSTTLPYFVRANGSSVWLNEHYGNRIAVIDTATESMTEYSEANPPVYNGTAIDNSLTIALTHNGVWFTSTSKNYVAFLSGSFRPSFSLSVMSGHTIDIVRGQNATVRFEVRGSWSSPLKLQFSDTENYMSVPKLIRLEPNETSVEPGHGSFSLLVNPLVSLPPGRYTLAVTVGDGLIFRTVFIFLVVR